MDDNDSVTLPFMGCIFIFLDEGRKKLLGAKRSSHSVVVSALSTYCLANLLCPLYIPACRKVQRYQNNASAFLKYLIIQDYFA